MIRIRSWIWAAALGALAASACVAADRGAELESLFPTTSPAGAGAWTPLGAVRVRERAEAPWTEVLATSPPGGGLELALLAPCTSLASTGDRGLRIAPVTASRVEILTHETHASEALDGGLLWSASRAPISPQAAALVQGGRCGPSPGDAALRAQPGQSLEELCPGGDCDKWLKGELEKWVKRLAGRPLPQEAAWLRRLIDEGHVVLDTTGSVIPLTAPGDQCQLSTDSSGVITFTFNAWGHDVETMERLVPLVIVTHLLVAGNPSLDWTDAVFIALSLETLEKEKDRAYVADFFLVLVLVARSADAPLMEALYGYSAAALAYADGTRDAVEAVLADLRGRMEAAGQELKGLPSTEVESRGTRFGQALARLFELKRQRDWEAIKSEFGLDDAQVEVVKRM